MSGHGRRRGGGNRRFGGGHNGNSSNSFGGRQPHQGGRPGAGAHEQPDAPLCKFFLLGGASKCNSAAKGCKFAHSLQRVADVPCVQGAQQQARAVCSFKNESGTHVVTGGKDGKWRMWNCMDWRLENEVQMEGEVHALAVENGFLVCGYEGPTQALPGVTVGLCRAWNLAQPATPYNFQMSEQAPFAHNQRVYALQLKIDASPEVYTGGHEGNIHCWGFDGASNRFQLVKKLEGHVMGVTCLALFRSSGNFLLSGSMDRSVRIWGVDDPQKPCQGMLTKHSEGHGDVVTSLAVLRMGELNYFVTGGMDQHVCVWNASGNREFHQRCGGPVLSLAVAADPQGTAIVLCGLLDGTVELRQPALGFRLRSTLSSRFSAGHSGEVKDLCVGDAYFCSVGSDNKLMVWQWVAPMPVGR